MRFIDPQKSFTYFNSNFNLKKTSKGWYTFDCPFCGKSHKMAVNFGIGFAKCWVCEWRGNVYEFVKDFENVSFSDAKYKIQTIKPSAIKVEDIIATSNAIRQEVSGVDLPIGYKGILDGDGIMAQRAREYLMGRGFDLDRLDRMGIGYVSHKQEVEPSDDYFGYIIIPFLSMGELVYYIGRDFIGNFLRYKNPLKEQTGVGKGDVLFNEDALHLYETAFIVEGWADAVTIGENGVSTQGWSLSQRQKRLIMSSEVDRLVFVPDAGVDGTGKSFYEKALESATSFINSGKEVYVLDLNVLDSGKDINELGKDVIMGLYNSSEPMDFETITMTLMGL